MPFPVCSPEMMMTCSMIDDSAAGWLISAANNNEAVRMDRLFARSIKHQSYVTEGMNRIKYY